MKACLIYDFLTEQGGLEREMANHAKMLKESGFEVEVLTYAYDSGVLERTGFEDTKVTNISAIKTKFEFVNIFLSVFLSFLGINLLKGKNPDFFITYSFPANFIVRNKKIKKINFMNHYPHFLYLSNKEKMEWAAATPGYKRFFVVFLSWFLGEYFKRLDSKLVRKSDLNFANSNFTKRRLDKIYNIKSIVSYPPIREVFKPTSRRIKKEFIFAAGRVIPDKKYDWLIEACSHIKTKPPIYISGEGDEEYIKKLEDLAKAKKVNLSFVEKDFDSLLVYYSSAKVLAFSTPGEDFGLVPAESLSCGTPVVAWKDESGPTEQVIHGLNGYLAKSYDLKDFASRLEQAMKENLKSKNRTKIIKSSRKFSYKEVKKEFIKEIKKVLN